MYCINSSAVSCIPVILGSDGDTLDMRRRKEAGDDPTLTGMQ